MIEWAFDWLFLTILSSSLLVPFRPNRRSHVTWPFALDHRNWLAYYAAIYLEVLPRAIFASANRNE